MWVRARGRGGRRRAVPAYGDSLDGWGRSGWRNDGVSRGAGSWMLGVLAATVAVLLARWWGWVPDWVTWVSAGANSWLLTLTLTARLGGPQRLFGGLAAGAIVGTVATQWSVLVAGAAVSTAVVAALVAMVTTAPAATFGQAAREAAYALGVCSAGMVTVLAYVELAPVGISVTRFGYAVLLLALVAALAVVYSLGAGVYGLGRTGLIIAAVLVVLVMIGLAYGQAMATWGNEILLAPFEGLRSWLATRFVTVPNPTMSLLGVPALVWGTSMRSRRPQGWWVMAFGVAATAPMMVRLLQPEVPLTVVVLGTLYSWMVGCLLGWVAIRVEQYMSGSGGRRARREEVAAAPRPEPARFAPLH